MENIHTCKCKEGYSGNSPFFIPNLTIYRKMRTVLRGEFIHYYKCMDCLTRWAITHQEGYHYPIFRWNKRS